MFQAQQVSEFLGTCLLVALLSRVGNYGNASALMAGACLAAAVAFAPNAVANPAITLAGLVNGADPNTALMNVAAQVAGAVAAGHVLQLVDGGVGL